MFFTSLLGLHTCLFMSVTVSQVLNENLMIKDFWVLIRSYI